MNRRELFVGAAQAAAAAAVGVVEIALERRGPSPPSAGPRLLRRRRARPSLSRQPQLNRDRCQL